MQSHQNKDRQANSNQADQQPSQDDCGLSAEELARQESSDLPERDAMSLVNLNAAVPVNAAIAANVLSDGSTAEAAALQQTPISQGI